MKQILQLRSTLAPVGDPLLDRAVPRLPSPSRTVVRNSPLPLMPRKSLDSVQETTVWVMVAVMLAISLSACYLLWAKVTWSWPFGLY